MVRVKIYQYTELEQTDPQPQFFDMDEEPYADRLFLLPIAAAAEGVRMLLATDGPNAPLPLDVEVKNIGVRRIVCTHPDIAGQVVIEFPNSRGYLSD